MHGWETRMLLKYYLERDVSKAELARRFGVSRRTIHEWVETGQLDRDLSSGGARYAPRPAMPHKLAPYTGIIEARLEEFPGLSATRLFDEVRAAGYPGGYSRVRDEVRAVRPREPVEAVVRFETPAGRQGQVDLFCCRLLRPSRLLKNTRIGLFSWPSCVSRPPRQRCARGHGCPDEGASDTRGRRSGTPRLQIPQPDQVIGGGGRSIGSLRRRVGG